MQRYGCKNKQKHRNAIQNMMQLSPKIKKKKKQILTYQYRSYAPNFDFILRHKYEMMFVPLGCCVIYLLSVIGIKR